MRELTAEESTEYLERAIKTEVALRNLRESKNTIDRKVREQQRTLDGLARRPSSSSIREPRNNPPREPVKPEAPKKHTAVDKFADHPTIIGWGLELMRAGSANSYDQKRYAEAMAKYESDMADYRKRLAAYNERHEKDLEDYRRRVREADDKDRKIKRDYPRAIKNGEQASAEIARQIAETERVLEQLYDLDVIFPKYRELVALCSMYEYFITGRVTTFKGADGAYNLFESELRQNLIIASIQDIGSQLEDIKRNQYTLYSEMKRSNELLSGISSSLDATLATVSSIRQLTAVNNVLTASVAENAEALKYIALLK